MYYELVTRVLVVRMTSDQIDPGGFGDAGDRKHGYHDTTGFAALIQYTGARFNNIG